MDDAHRSPSSSASTHSNERASTDACLDGSNAKRRCLSQHFESELYDIIFNDGNEAFPLESKLFAPAPSQPAAASQETPSFPPHDDDASYTEPAPSMEADASVPSPNDEQQQQSQTQHSVYHHCSDTETFPFDLPSQRISIITTCMAVAWSIRSPRYFQIFAVFAMVYLSSQLIYLIQKMGEGKSLVILTVAALLCGVTIVMVPLIGLGSDQVNKSFKLSERVEAYHVDENKGEDFIQLCERLLSIKAREGRTANSIILYCSPQSLHPDSMMHRILRLLAKRNLITSVFVDEAHTIHREGINGSNFRPEFDAAFDSLMAIVALQEKKPNICVMSATLPEKYQATITKYTKRAPSLVLWGGMARRNIFFGVQVLGRPSAAIKRQLDKDYEKNPTRKVLIYTNSKVNAETTLTSTSESILQKLKIAGEVIALTGDCGIMLKTFLMAAFCGKSTFAEFGVLPIALVNAVLIFVAVETRT